MTIQQSFSKIEHELQPRFRELISGAESTEDVKKFFVYTIQELFSRVFDGKLEVGFEDIRLQPEREPPFVLSDQILSREELSSLQHSSDLPQVMTRFAQMAIHRYRHLQKNPAKTEAKIKTHP